MSIGWKSFYQLIAANVLMALIILFKFRTLPPQIPLFYSKPIGEEQLADIWFIVVLPFFMNALFFLNNLISRKFFNDDPFIKKIFYFVDMFLIISFTLIFAKIVFLVS